MKMTARAAVLFSWMAAVLMLFQVSLDILGKFLFSMPVPGTAEMVASYYMIALVFMALPLVEYRDETIAVDLVYDRFGPSLKLACRILALLFTLSFYGVFAWTTWQAALHSMAIREVILGAVELQIWPSRFFLPAGCVLAAVVVILKQIEGIMALREVTNGPR